MATLASCTEAEHTPFELRRERLSVGGEVFRVFCKRAAAEAFPDDLEGTSFNDACEGKGDAPRPNTRFAALLARREGIVLALDRVLGGDEAQERGEVAALLEEDELASFLRKTLPLYDPPERLPDLTRALAYLLDRLVDEDDALGREALDMLAKSSGRVGYRPLELALGVARPLLEYPRIDELTARSLEMLREGGKSAGTFDSVVRALSLELATAEDTPPAPDSTFVLARDLLLSPLEGLDDGEIRTPLWLVRRDARGVALPERLDASALPMPFVDRDGDGRADIDGFGRLLLASEGAHAPAPFRVPSEEQTERDADGRALNVWAPDGALLYRHLDVQTSVLAALAREQRSLLTPKKPGDRTTVDKIARGLPAMLGPFAEQTASYGKANVTFRGPDLSRAPVLDLVHAIGVIAKNPDTRKLLEVLKLQLRDHEPESAALVDALLKIDARADAHPEATTIGRDGPGTAHVFWDDLIKIGRRMTARPGLIEALMRSFLDPRAPAQGPLLGNWMRYKDRVSYPNSPSADPKDFNQPAQEDYDELVDRQKPDHGFNRSLWQRTLALVHSLRGQKQCNKNNAKLQVHLAGIPLTLPLFGSGYKPCELFEVPDMIEIHSLATLGRARIDLKPGDLKALGGLCPVVDATCLGKTQETESAIVGFDDTPTPEALARFIFAPPNAFVQGFVDPAPTLDGISIRLWEPDALFPMEVIDPMAKPYGEPDHPGLNFLQAGYTLVEAFDDHELRDAQGKLQDGYLFGDLLSTLHMHWAARSDAPCAGPPAETCTQSKDPSARFYSHQTNLVSYEPLISEAFLDERLLDRLHEATLALADTQVEGEDGITILSRFLTFMLTPDPNLTYRDGTKSARDNLGEEIGYVSPLYLLLDALKANDRSFASQEHAHRLPVWQEARSELIDTMFAIEERNGEKRMKDRIGRALSMRVLDFVKERLTVHRDAGDLESWSAGLVGRAEDVLKKPVVPALISLLDETYDNEKAAQEMASLLKYLFEEEGSGFTSSLLAAADLLQLLDDAAATAPILKLAGEAIAPSVLKAIQEGGKFEVETGVARAFVELQYAMSQEDKGRPSTTAKLMRNLVAASMEDGRSPLENLLDAVAEIRRADPTADSHAPLDAKDLRAVLSSVRDFLADEDRGLERLYSVIQHRELEKN